MTEETSNGHVKHLTLEEILAADDLPEKDLFVPQWQGWVKVKGLSRKNVRRAYAEALDDQTGQTNQDEAAKRLICWGSVEPKITLGNYDRLVDKNAGAVSLLVDAIVELSGMAPDALQRARDAFRR